MHSNNRHPRSAILHHHPLMLTSQIWAINTISEGVVTRTTTFFKAVYRIRALFLISCKAEIYIHLWLMHFSQISRLSLRSNIISKLKSYLKILQAPILITHLNHLPYQVWPLIIMPVQELRGIERVQEASPRIAQAKMIPNLQQGPKKREVVSANSRATVV